MPLPEIPGAPPCAGCAKRVDPDTGKIVTATSVWYADGSARKCGDWLLLPADGVQYVRVDYADGTARVMNGADWYFTAEGNGDRIYGHTSHAEDLARYQQVVALRGSWTDDATFAAIERRAMTAGA